MKSLGVKYLVLPAPTYFLSNVWSAQPNLNPCANFSSLLQARYGLIFSIKSHDVTT
ncbi:MAG: hypothetical protein MJ195_02755 [Mycoplasmoidaceae bacterium]|nr:hypothetical protein [Mycoplasmoidaceae bacterium]